MKRRIIIIISAVCLPLAADAQMFDGVRMADYTQYDLRSRAAIDAQSVAVATMAYHHKWITQKEESIADLKKEYNDYLQKLHDVIAQAAQLYGIYYEGKELAETIGRISEVVQESPENILANAFKDDKNKLMSNIYIATTDLLYDIKKAILDKTRMSEKERIEEMDGIRKRMKEINRMMRKLEFNMRYYNLCDLWNDIRNKTYDFRRKTNRQIAIEARDEWQNHFKPILSSNQ